MSEYLRPQDQQGRHQEEEEPDDGVGHLGLFLPPSPPLHTEGGVWDRVWRVWVRQGVGEV